MSMSARSRVFSAYRRLFRARTKLFSGDVEAMQKSRISIREQFMLNKDAPTEGEHFEAMLGAVDEAEDMLLFGFVRGELNRDTGHYEVKIKKEHTAGSEMPHLEPVTPEYVEKLEKPMVSETKADKPKSR